MDKENNIVDRHSIFFWYKIEQLFATKVAPFIKNALQ